MKLLKIFILMISALLVSAAWAAESDVSLSIPGMTCPVCPITVKKALSQVNGIHKVDINIEQRQALVKFDDQKTNTSQILKTVADAGYPASIKH